jgi:hypothetical protein
MSRLREPLFRFHPVGLSALYWGLDPPRVPPARFDALDGSYGVLYAGRDTHAAFVETFGHSTGIRLLQESTLASRVLSRLSPGRPLRLVPLTGRQLARMGVDARLAVGGDYDLARRWSWAFYHHPLRPDGILYPARHDERRRSVALFDRAADALTEELIGVLSDRAQAPLLGELLDHYAFGLMQG